MIEKVQRDVLHQFAVAAEAYCRLLESHEHLSDEAFTRRCASALTALYHDALALPESHTLPKLEDGCDETHAVYEMRFADPRVSDQTQERFTAHNVDLHWLYANPFDPDSSLTVRVSQDLDEIYTGVRKGLALYRLGTECALLYAAFEWQFGLISHWGTHLVQALPALHQITMDDQLAKMRAAKAEGRGDV